MLITPIKQDKPSEASSKKPRESLELSRSLTNYYILSTYPVSWVCCIVRPAWDCLRVRICLDFWLIGFILICWYVLTHLTRTVFLRRWAFSQLGIGGTDIEATNETWTKERLRMTRWNLMEFQKVRSVLSLLSTYKGKHMSFIQLHPESTCFVEAGIMQGSFKRLCGSSTA